MKNFKIKWETKYYVYKIIKKIKKSTKDAYEFGIELSTLSRILYEILYDENNGDIIFDNAVLYNKLLANEHFINLTISDYFSEYISYYDFFKYFSSKIEKIKPKILFSFFRGYYINDMILYNTNIMYSYLIPNYFVLFDFHPYFLNIIYKYMNTKNDIQNKMKFLLNYDNDEYSTGEYINSCTYKLIFIHKHKYYNNSIKNFLKLLYKDIISINELYSKDDEILYNIYSNSIYTETNF